MSIQRRPATLVSLHGRPAQWFPSIIPWSPSAGERFEVDEIPAEVLELYPGTMISWKAGAEIYRFEVLDSPGSCRFLFVHCFEESVATAAQYAAGWETYLQRLRIHLAGGYLSEEEAHKQMTGAQNCYDALFGSG